MRTVPIVFMEHGSFGGLTGARRMLVGCTASLHALTGVALVLLQYRGNAHDVVYICTLCARAALRIRSLAACCG